LESIDWCMEDGTEPARIVQGFEMTGQWPVNVDRPLKAIASLHHNQTDDPVIAAAFDHELQREADRSEIHRLKKLLREKDRQLKKCQLSSNATSKAASSGARTSDAESSDITISIESLANEEQPNFIGRG